MSQFKFEFTEEELFEMVECISICNLSVDEAFQYAKNLHAEIKTPLDEDEQEA